MALVTINGKEIEVADGTLILDAAKEAGFHIPTFCYHAKLSKLGSCRMCLVEIEGMRKLQPSCVTPIMEGMKVSTESPQVVNARKGQLEFLLINHPLDCPVCDQAGECDLQDLTYKYGATEGRFRWKKRTFPKRDMGPTITKEMNRCIACRRCSRFCSEISGDYSITELNRGNELEMGTFCHTPIESEFVGNTIQLCPVGALTSSAFRFKARSWDLKSAETICTHCSVGCSIVSQSKYVSTEITHLLQTKTLGNTPALNNSEIKVLRNDASSDKGVTDISICDRGRYGYHFINSDERLKKPLVRKDGKLVESGWDEALALVASKIKEIKNTSGPSAIGGITSGICTNEDAFAFQKFLREVVGTGNIDMARGAGLSTASVKKLSSMRGGVASVKSCDAILIIGSSLSTDTPILSMNAGIAARMGGASLTVATSGENRLLTSKPRRIELAPGSELAFIGALTKAVVDEKLYVEDASSLAGDLGAGLAKAGAEAAHVSAELLSATAAELARASRGAILFGDDILSSAKGNLIVSAIHNLAALLGYNGHRGQVIYASSSSNYRGNVDMGINPELGAGLAEAAQKGMSWTAMQKAALDGSLKALFVMGDDPVETSADRAAMQSVLEKVDFLVVSELFLTRTAALADVVFPAASYAEKNGTVTNLEGRVQQTNVSIRPIGECRPDWKIFADLAGKLRVTFPYGNACDISREIGQINAAYGSLAGDDAGRDGFIAAATPSAAHDAVSFDASPKGDGISIVAGRDVYLKGSLAGRDAGLLKLAQSAKVYVGEKLAAQQGISDGETVKIETGIGSISALASVTPRVPSNTVVVPCNRADMDARAIFGGDFSSTTGQVSKA